MAETKKAKYLLLGGDDCTRQGDFNTEVIYDTLEEAQKAMRKGYQETAEGYCEDSDDTVEILEDECMFYCNDMGAGCPRAEIETSDEWWKIIEIPFE